MSDLRPHPHPLLTKKLRDKTEGGYGFELNQPDSEVAGKAVTRFVYSTRPLKEEQLTTTIIMEKGQSAF